MLMKTRAKTTNMIRKHNQISNNNKTKHDRHCNKIKQHMQIKTRAGAYSPQGFVLNLIYPPFFPTPRVSLTELL